LKAQSDAAPLQKICDICLPQSPRRTQKIWKVIHHPANDIGPDIEVDRQAHLATRKLRKQLCQTLKVFSPVQAFCRQTCPVYQDILPA